MESALGGIDASSHSARYRMRNKQGRCSETRIWRASLVCRVPNSGKSAFLDGFYVFLHEVGEFS